MARRTRHEVTLRTRHPIEVGNVDVELVVRHGSSLVGTLRVSVGGIDWYPRNAKRPRQATWEQFDAWMDS